MTYNGLERRLYAAKEWLLFTAAILRLIHRATKSEWLDYISWGIAILYYVNVIAAMCLNYRRNRSTRVIWKLYKSDLFIILFTLTLVAIMLLLKLIS